MVCGMVGSSGSSPTVSRVALISALAVLVRLLLRSSRPFGVSFLNLVPIVAVSSDESALGLLRPVAILATGTSDIGVFRFIPLGAQAGCVKPVPEF